MIASVILVLVITVSMHSCRHAFAIMFSFLVVYRFTAITFDKSSLDCNIVLLLHNTARAYYTCFNVYS